MAKAKSKRENAEAFIAACEMERARRRLPHFIPWATPGLQLPAHLPELTQAFSDGLTTPQRVCFSAPPQFGKSLAIINGLIWDAWRRPGLVSAYVTYGTEPARARATEARQLLQRLPFLRARSNTERIRFDNGAQLLFTSTDGPLESHAITGWLVVDDPYKNPAEATSSVDRKRIEEWFFGTALGRLHERTSVMVNHHRWTEHDLIEKLRRHEGQRWRYKNYPALNALDQSLWESFKSSTFLKELRATTLRSVWEAYYQGNPQPEGGRLFRGTYYYDPSEAFKDGYRVAIGIDCAYGDKKGGDWNAIVVLARKGKCRHVLEVSRSHEPSPAFEARLKRVLARYPGSVARWYPGPSELGLAQRLERECGVQIPVATKNKKLRAEHCAAAWNEDLTINPQKEPLILVPRADYVWLPDFLEEIHDFTGLESQDLHDDQVDALAAADDALEEAPAGRIIGIPGSLGTGQWGGLVTNLH